MDYTEATDVQWATEGTEYADQILHVSVYFRAFRG